MMDDPRQEMNELIESEPEMYWPNDDEFDYDLYG